MSLLFPENHVNSVFDIDFNALYQEGYRLLLFDIDNTLVPHDQPADKNAKDFFSYVKKIGFICVIISNNNETRVKSFSDDINADAYEYHSHKPNPKSYLNAMKKFNIPLDRTIFFGDQLFTDILGANIAGVRSMLVKPIKKYDEPAFIKVKRMLEEIVLFFFRHSNKYKNPKKSIPIK